MSDETQPTKSDAVDRVEALLDEGDNLRALVPTGEGDAVWYYVAIMTRQHGGEEYLNERYVALAKEWSDEYEDSFRKNGINRRRGSQSLPMALSHAYKMVWDQDRLGHEDSATAFIEPERVGGGG